MGTHASIASFLRWPRTLRWLDRYARDGECNGKTHPDDPDGEIPRWSGLVWLPLLVFAVLFYAGVLYLLWRAVF